MTDKELEAIVSSIEGLAARLDALDEALSESSTEEVNRTRRQAARERRLLRDEIASSQGISASAADDLNRIRDGIDQALVDFTTSVEEAKAEIEAKSESARTGRTLMQSQLIDLQQGITEAQLALNELQQGHLTITQDEAVMKENLATAQDSFTAAQGNVNKVAAEAAATAVKELSQQAIKEEIQRQLRLQQVSGASS